MNTTPSPTPTSDVTAASSATTTAPAPRRNPFAAIARVPFGAQVLIGLVLGVVLGLVAAAMGPASGGGENWLTTTLDTIGTSFITLLKAIVPPLVFLAIVSSIANLRQVTNAARLAWQTLLWFALTSAIAVGIGIALGALTKPGAHTNVAKSAAKAADHSGTWLDFLVGLIPSNALGIGAKVAKDGTASITFNTLQILVIAIAVGIAVLSVGAKADPFLSVVNSLLAIVQKLLWWIIRLAPLGTVGLLGYAVVAYGWGTIGSLGWFVADIYIGLLLVAFVVYPILLKANGLKIGAFTRGVWPATSLGFVSRSSMGTMPMTQTVTERLGVPRHYASFAIPLGATTKMDGCAAIYPAIAAIFVANFFGVDLSIWQYVLIAIVSILGSAATAGMTGATVMLTLTLSTLGLPLEGVGLLMAIDPILDMGRTALNVTGQSLVAVIVAKREKTLDQAQYDAAAHRAFNGDLGADDEAADRPDDRDRELVAA